MTLESMSFENNLGSIASILPASVTVTAVAIDSFGSFLQEITKKSKIKT
jgi:hypothetical protein